MKLHPQAVWPQRQDQTPPARLPGAAGAPAAAAGVIADAAPERRHPRRRLAASGRESALSVRGKLVEAGAVIPENLGLRLVADALEPQELLDGHREKPIRVWVVG